MDLMLIAISFFTIVVTCTVSFFVIQKLFPHHNQEIEITKAFKAENYHKVIEIIEKSRSINAYYSLNVYSFVAQSYSKINLHQESIVWWDQALTKLDLSKEDRIFVELEIGDEYFLLKNLKQSEVHYRTAVSLNSEHEKAIHKLAQNLFFQKKPEKCRKLLRPILKHNPSLIDSRKLYAECLSVLGFHTKAIRHYAFLEDINEYIDSLNYAQTLKNLKMWDKAYSVYQHLLEQNLSQDELEIIMCQLVEVSIAMKKYHESLGLIEKFLLQMQSPSMILELKYLRANIFFLRGDQMLALQEFQQLYKINPFYKDLKSFVEQNEHWLTYPFLFNYFTSNENHFESLITRLAPAGSSIVRRSSQFFLCMKDNVVSAFYRELRPITKNIVDLIETLAFQYCPEIEKLEIWTIDGIDYKYTITGQKYRFIVRERDDFLVQTNIAVSQMDHIDGGAPLNFVGGFQDIPEIIPRLQESVDEKVDIILNNTIDDKLIDKAFDF